MTKTIDYYLTLVSPWSFLGHDRFVKIASDANASINVIPVDFGRVFSETGGLPLAKRSAQRQKYRLMELARWKKELNIPFNTHPAFFPASDQIAALMVTAAVEQGLDAVALTGMYLKLVWMEEGNIADEKTAIAVADRAGLDGAALFKDSKDPGIEALYNAHTEEAIERGAFGAPTYVIDDELFWGQDRLNFVEKKLNE